MNNIEIFEQRIDDKHLDSFWYDGLIAAGDVYELRALGDIRYTGDEPKDDKELAKLYDDSKFSLHNWFEINYLDDDYSGGLVCGNYDDAIEALIKLEKEYKDENKSK